MKKSTQDLILGLRIFADIALVCAAWVGAYYLRFYTVIPYEHLPDPVLYFKLLPFVAVIWLGIFTASGFYRRTGRHRSAFVEALDILQSCVFATLSFIAFTYVYEQYVYSRIAMMIFAFLHPAMIIGGRSAIRKFLRAHRRHAPARRTLIIGSGDTLRHAIELAKVGDLTRSEILGVIPIGATQAGKTERLLGEYQLTEFEKPNDWAQFFHDNPTETVIFALPHKSYPFLDQEFAAIVDQVADIKMIPDLIRYTRFAAGVDVIGGTPVINVHESPLSGFGTILKRLLDMSGAALGLILAAPVMLLVALAVKLSSRGPVFYRQERMGLDGRRFEIIKFRSMPVGIEGESGAVWAQPGDARPTALGRLLRRTNIDELPQLVNVLRGDMSLVGPRPERPVFVEKFRSQVPGYYLRHKVKAGLTGWAQVNGWRGNTSLERRIECDLYYIQNWSIWLDLRIIILTIFRGFINAY